MDELDPFNPADREGRYQDGLFTVRVIDYRGTNLLVAVPASALRVALQNMAALTDDMSVQLEPTKDDQGRGYIMLYWHGWTITIVNGDGQRIVVPRVDSWHTPNTLSDLWDTVYLACLRQGATPDEIMNLRLMMTGDPDTTKPFSIDGERGFRGGVRVQLGRSYADFELRDDL